MSTVNDAGDLVLGNVYKLSGEVFCPDTLEANGSMFRYTKVDDMSLLGFSPIHTFVGVTTGADQVLSTSSLESRDKVWAKVETLD